MHAVDLFTSLSLYLIGKAPTGVLALRAVDVAQQAAEQMLVALKTNGISPDSAEAALVAGMIAERSKTSTSPSDLAESARIAVESIPSFVRAMNRISQIERMTQASTRPGDAKPAMTPSLRKAT